MQFRRFFVWACLVVSIAAVTWATSHMDYSIKPTERSGAKNLVKHGSHAFLIAEIFDKSGPCVPRASFVVAGLRK